MVLKKSKMVKMVGFICPTDIGAIGCGNPIKCSRAIANGMRNAKRGHIFFLPYNSGHYLLHGSFEEKIGYRRVEGHCEQGIPEQQSSKDCSYFIMRYMKDIVEDKNLEFFSKWEKRGKAAYTQQHIDEVRNEWAKFVVKTYM
ncbi:putative Ulp1 protease family catalytic domain-containing protein [Rosa chinensis]|uniref:Putative Ulp1 protease family catalytic domain-containing protein n=1 Tax=Rosa chinensis TaxID=74649 RepID=A0A2P6QAC0_ROSCH|nr:putative Ulp1 protease family catalytic domain-containing protein [Rosa chinensis]